MDLEGCVGVGVARLEAIEVNSSKSGVLSCGRESGKGIVGGCLHHSVGTGPGAMEFGRSAWGRAGVIEHHLVAKLEERAVSMGVVDVGLMALSSAEMFADEETSLFYEICCELRVLGCRLWDEGKLEIEC